MKAGINPRPAGALLAWMLHDIDNMWPRGSAQETNCRHQEQVIGG
jgi:hypothetical protein